MPRGGNALTSISKAQSGGVNGVVLARDERRCQARLDGCSILCTQVHHLSYKHQFNEPLFEARRNLPILP
jgi:hypothetical protein